MGIIRINQLPDGSGSLSIDDIVLIMDDPSGSKISKQISLSTFRNVILNQPASLQIKQGTNSELIANILLQGEPAYVTDTKKMYIGDGYTNGGLELKVQPIYPDTNGIPSGFLRIKSNTSSSTFSTTLRASTGYVGVQSPSGTVQIFGNGNSNSDISTSISLPTTNNGSYAKNSIKEFYYWSCTSGNASLSGHITKINNSTDCFEMNLEELYAIQSLDLGSNSNIRYINLKNSKSFNNLNGNVNPSLEWINIPYQSGTMSVNCNGHSNLKWVNFEGCSGLTTCYLTYNDNLERINFLNCTNMTFLGVDNSKLSTINLSTNTNLNWLQAGNTSISVLNLSNNKINNLSVDGCSLLHTVILSPSINSVNTFNFDNCNSLNTINFNNSYINASFKNCGFSSSKLNYIYTNLPTLPAGSKTIFVFGNPGITNHDPSIATSKGYVVDTTTT